MNTRIDGDNDRPAGVGVNRAPLIAFVQTRVRLRFTVDAAAFVDRILRDIEPAAADGTKPLIERIARLCLDDLYLASACAAGDDTAWAECSATYFGFIREFASRFLPDAESRDLADQVIADLWQRGKLARYEGRSRLRTWLGAVVAHAALNVRQSRRYLAPSEPAEAESRATARVQGETHDEESARLLSALVGDAIGELSADDQLLLLLSYEQGMSLEAIGSQLGTSKPTLSRRLKRLRQQLRAAVDRMARDRFRTPADRLRSSVDLSRIELDLARLLKHP